MSAAVAASGSSSAAAATAAAATSTGAAQASSAAAAAASSQPDFLTLILELDPRRLLSDPTSARLLLEGDGSEISSGSGSGSSELFTAHLLPALLIFLNAHIALQHGNGLAIYLATPSSPTRLIYTSAPGRIAASSAAAQQQESESRPDPNTYQHFGVVNRALWAAVRAAVQDAADHDAAREDEDSSSGHEDEDDGEAGQRRRKKRRRKGPMTGTGPLVSALSQALAHLNNIPPSSSSSSSSAAQASSLPSGHSASILPRANASAPSSSSKGATESVAGGGLSSWRLRILILSTLDGGAGGPTAGGKGSGSGAGSAAAMAYVPLMNCIFAAQKRSILIDVLKLCPGQDVVFLQQAAHLTGGNYLRLDLDEKGDAVALSSTRNQQGGRNGSAGTKQPPLSLLQVLMTTFLPSRDLRYFPPSLAFSSSTPSAGTGVGILRLPTLDSVDFRAACFCHRTVVDVGFVCSVCLSIFCEPRKECLICGSRFPRSTMRRFADEDKISTALLAFNASTAAQAR
ncbi:RNA polymerase II transcription factor B subunit 4 [Tilletia horrida]|nr:RNA polymerase II transcription factor B subunit 4 [Tilletia horrida]